MLTEIQRDAINRARMGNFDLLDAMELDHRIRTRQCDAGLLTGGRLRFVVKTGAVTGLACMECDDGVVPCTDCDAEGRVDCETCTTRGTVQCPKCEGDGCAECEDGVIKCADCEGRGDLPCATCKGDAQVECMDCDGTGSLSLAEIEAPVRIQNLDGDTVFRGYYDEPGDPTPDCKEVDRNWSGRGLREYQRDKQAEREAAAEADKAEAAKPLAQATIFED